MIACACPGGFSWQCEVNTRGDLDESPRPRQRNFPLISSQSACLQEGFISVCVNYDDRMTPLDLKHDNYGSVSHNVVLRSRKWK